MTGPDDHDRDLGGGDLGGGDLGDGDLGDRDLGDRDLGGPTELEEQLRVVLRQQAGGLVPSDRIDEIRARVAGDESRGRPAWLLPLAAAAAVAAISVVAWLGFRPHGVTLPVAGNTSSAAPTVTLPTGSATGSVTSPPATTSASVSPPPTTPPTATTSRALPVYFVEQVGPDRWGLVREFVPQPVPVAADAATLGTASLDLSMHGTPAHATTNLLRAWPPGTTSSVRFGGPEIGVVLSQPGAVGLTPEQQRVAVQQVVWAVTAGLHQDKPVSITVEGGGPIFETQPNGIYKRPAPGQVGRDVAPIWLDSPSPGSVLPASSPVDVSGQACTFEANVAWRLERGGAAVAIGAVTASAACPSLGSWKVDLGRLPAGDYTFHAIETSAADGSLTADQRLMFTVK